MATKKQQPQPQPQSEASVNNKRKTISLNASTPKPGSGFTIPVPSGWNSAKTLVTEKAAQVTQVVNQKVRTVHRTSTRKSAENAFQTAERISAEATGFVSGLLRKTIGTVTGAVAGVASGTRGASPEQVNRLRMGGGELVLLGNWTRIRNPKNSKVPVVEMNLEYDLNLVEVEFGTVATLALAHAQKTKIEINETKTPVTLVPIVDSDSRETTGFVLLVEDETKAVYRWTDEQ